MLEKEIERLTNAVLNESTTLTAADEFLQRRSPISGADGTNTPLTVASKSNDLPSFFHLDLTKIGPSFI